MKTTKLAIVLVFFVALLLPLSSVKCASTMVEVTPALTTVNLPNNGFQVNVTVSQVTNLAAWDFKLYYRSSILNASSISEGPFLKQGGSSTSLLILNFTDNYNATYGRIWAACTIIGQGPGISGSGTLATITFKAKAGGNAVLHLQDTMLDDANIPPGHIPHSDVDGLVQVFVADIAIVNLCPQCCQTIIGTKNRNPATDPIKLNLTVENIGNLAATIKNITVYMNTTIINVTNNVYLSPGTIKSIMVTWTSFATFFGSYTLSAYAFPLAGEANMTNNTFVYGRIQFTIMGDVNGDHHVNVLDLIVIANALFATPGNPKYNPNADINADGVVNVLDLIDCARYLGTNYP